MVQNGFSVFKENYGTINHQHGSLNVPIEHHPTIRYMVYNGYYKVMSNIPKMGQLPTPDQCQYYVYIYIYRIMVQYTYLELKPYGKISLLNSFCCSTIRLLFETAGGLVGTGWDWIR